MKILFAIFVLGSLNALTQHDLFFPLKDEFDWKKVEKQNQALKIQLIKQWDDEFDEDNPPDVRPLIYAEDDLYQNYLHVIDFDNDGLDDLVYEGPTNGEAQFVIFYHNTAQKFKVVLEETQQVFRMEFDKGRVSKIFLKDPGCCCSYKGQNKILIADYDFHVKFEVLSITTFYNPTESPEKYLNKPLKINIPNTTTLQIEPNDKDSIQVEWCTMKDIQSNFIAEIPANSLAWILAEKTEKGKTWLYIAVFPETRLKNSLLAHYYASRSQHASYKLGWIAKESAEVGQ